MFHQSKNNGDETDGKKEHDKFSDGNFSDEGKTLFKTDESPLKFNIYLSPKRNNKEIL